MANPFSFADADGCDWIMNPDGSYRCLHAEIPSMRFEDIEREFGPLSVPEHHPL